ncbi:outer membrane protein transport protein [Flavobacterium sp. NRK F10]|uniref:outer membrane protein transport protein n=1 Tax=Flavobacterium sp. NRK F10 TaxID=2954931 RepID=UPI00209175D4|nr:outer membrane protein transport protein [Flavobacterium sp. NRK F10]MCO6174843.1 outer membrane protein transport protein [Flavobacterium sp. NRK F10]
MKENKNIERLFQEKFKDFEVQPPQDAWSNIEERLNEKKKKRRVLPFWFKASGIAASLVLGFFLFYFAKDSFFPGIIDRSKPDGGLTNEVPGLVNGKSNTEKTEQQDNEKSGFDQNNPNGVFVQPGEIVTGVDNGRTLNEAGESSSYREDQFVDLEKQQNKRTERGNRSEKNQLVKPSILKKGEALVNNNREENEKAGQNNSDRNSLKWVETEPLTNNNSGISDHKNKQQEGLILQEEGDYQNDLINELKQQQAEQNIADAKTNKTNYQKGKIAIEEDNDGLVNGQGVNNTIVQNNNNGKEKTNVEELLNQINTGKELTEGVIDFNKNEIDGIAEFDNNVKVIDSSLFNNKVLADLEKQIVQDSSQVAEVLKEENALEKLLKEKEEGKNADEKEKEEKRNKWAVSTSAAPVYFNSLTEGSPLDEQFASNTKSYQTSLSYGVGVQYQVTPKLALRAGINNLALSYDTQNVYHSSVLKRSIGTQQLAESTLHVDRTQAAQSVVLYNKSANVYGDVENFTQDEIGSLNQQIGYIEVPFELTYKLLDKKFGIEVIGGMSTLFLQQNEVKLLSEGMEMDFGKANNLNNIHFSSNVGLGFKYVFFKSFQANLQPMFKYQINTFSENAGNFKPYAIGLYTGISYHF